MSHSPGWEVQREPVAIIGAGCRLPGASTVDAYWDLLSTGRDVVAAMSPERRALDLTKSMADSRHMRSVGDEGGFLDRIDTFDAHFFEISPYEAVRLDPQQRLLLETTWEAVEDAGLSADRLAGSRTGVYTACFASHYWNLLTNAGMNDMHALLGASRYSVAAGRIAHLLDLRGPALGTEATCASSLVAVHLACQAIQLGEIEMAIVGGVNLLLCRDLDMSAAEAGLMSETSRCRFGDQAADGYVRSEGAVTLVLKPLSQAVKDGDRVYASIMGSALTSNGRQSQSLTGTETKGQEDMLRSAYRAAGVNPAHVDYIEAHGPGTPEGDAAELTALTSFLRDSFQQEGRSHEEPVFVGSAKSNIGHTEAAAGLAGLLKTALAVQHRVIPRTLHVHNPNTVLGADDSPIELVRTVRPWPERERPAYAGVTSLGTYGMNAHLVLTEPPAVAAKEELPPYRERALVMPLSARNADALRELASSYADTLEKAENPADVCFSAGARRTQHNVRMAVSGADRQVLIDQLRDYGSGGPSLSPTEVDSRLAGRPRIAFVFPGQGSQWVGMGRELLTSSPVFAERIDECGEVIRAELGWSLVDRLRSDAPLTALDEVQPALWAMQVALASVWRDWGIEPDLIIGHSMGENAAAAAAGALSVRDAGIVACRRSVIIDRFAPDGAMWSVNLSEAEAQKAIGEFRHSVFVGAVNSDGSVALSGDPAALLEVVEPLQRRGVFCRQVKVDFASHSPHVDTLLPIVRESLADVRPRAGTVPLHSTVLDRVVDGSEFDADYWAANLGGQVRFASAIRATLRDQPNTVFIEMSAHPVLTSAVEDGIEAAKAPAVVLPSLHRNSPEMVSLLTSLGMAYTGGCVPDWGRVNPGSRFVTLPTYPWQRKRFWVDPPGEPLAKATTPATTAVRTVARSVDALTRDMKLHVAAVLATSPELIDASVPLTFSGMDSLLAAKLRTRMQQELDLHIPIRDFLSSRSLNDLATRAHRTGYGPAS